MGRACYWARSLEKVVQKAPKTYSNMDMLQEAGNFFKNWAKTFSEGVMGWKEGVSKSVSQSVSESVSLGKFGSVSKWVIHCLCYSVAGRLSGSVAQWLIDSASFYVR